MLRSLRVACLVALAAACSKAPEPTPTPQPKDPPPAAKIATFTATPDTVKKGDPAKLAWSVEHAKSVSIRDSSGKSVAGVDAGAAKTGEVSVSPAETTTYLLVANGEAGASNDYAVVQVRVTVEDNKPTGVPLLMVSVPSTIAAGDVATLVWSGPEKVTIADDQGGTVDTKGAQSGTAVVRPVKTTTYTAKAGALTASAVVKVLPVVKRFWLSSEGGPVGSKVTLRWQTAGTVEVKVSEKSRGVLHTAAPDKLYAGSFEDTVPKAGKGTVLVYTINVKNADGTDSADRPFLIADQPVITSFTLPSAVTKGGAGMKAAWVVTGADRLSIAIGEAGGKTAVVFTTFDKAEAAMGNALLPAPAADSDYFLIARALTGAETVQQASVKVVDAPVITSFKATPTTVPKGGDKVTLTYAATSAASAIIEEGGRALFAVHDPAKAGAGTADVYPSQGATYRLVVRNAAGDLVEKTVSVTVTTPLTVQVVPSPSLPGESVTFSWDFPTASGVLGAPLTTFAKVSNKFLDIAGSPTRKELVFEPAKKDEGVLPIDFPAGFRFRHYGVSYARAHVSTNGFISFDMTTPSPKNSTTMPSASGVNNVLALFWDNLDLSTTGHIYHDLQGTAPERKLIVQFDHLQQKAGTNTDFVGQVVLIETGVVEFHYNAAVGAGFKPLIGLENQGGTDGVQVGTTPPPAGDGYVFFGDAPNKGTATVKPSVAGIYQLTALLPNGKAFVPAPVALVHPGSIEITEVMFDPTTGVKEDGQWIEVKSKLGGPLDLKEMTISTTGNATGHTIGASVLVPPGGFAVLAGSGDPTRNGGVKADYAWTGLPLAAKDSVKLALRGTALATLTYDGTGLTGTKGASLVKSLLVSPGTGFCVSTSAFGTQKGTPGAPNTPCPVGLAYAVELIPFAWEDVSGTGVEVKERAAVPFPAGMTFNLFGKPFTAAKASYEGYISFDGVNTGYTFAEIPSTKTPNATIAPFLEDFGGSRDDGLASKMYAQFFDPDGDSKTPDGYLVVQWSHMDFYSTFSGDADVNFEVKLFQDHHIEFHYGHLGAAGGASNKDRELGIEGQAGLENPAGDTAYLLVDKNPGLKPGLAVSWKPSP